MISIKLGDEFIKLPPGTKVSLEYNNNIFSTELLMAYFSLPITAPFEGNERILKFLNEILLYQRSNVRKGIESNRATLYHDATALGDGILKVNGQNENSFLLQLLLGIGQLKCMTTSLKQLNLGGSRTLGTDMASVAAFVETQVRDLYPNVDFNFPMHYNESFYGDANPDFEKYINQYDPNTGNVKINHTGNWNTLVPFPYIMYLIKQGFALDGYSIDGDFVTDPDKQQRMLYNNFALDMMDDNLHVHDSITSDQYDDATVMGSKIIPYDPSVEIDTGVCFDPTTGIFTVLRDGNYILRIHNTYRLSRLSDGVTFISWVETKIVGAFAQSVYDNQAVGSYDINVNRSFSMNFTPAQIGSTFTVSHRVYSQMGVFGPLPCPSTILTGSYIDLAYLDVPKVNIFATNMDLTNHVPDITFGNLLNAIIKEFSLQIDFDHVMKIAYINYSKDQLNNPAIDYDSLKNRVIKGYQTKIEQALYKSVNYTFGSDDDLVKDNFKPIALSNILTVQTNYYDLTVNFAAASHLVGKYAYVQNEECIYICVSDPSTSSYLWVQWSDVYYDLIINPDASNDLRVEIAPMFMRSYQYDSNNIVVIPAIKQSGTSIAFGVENNGYGLRTVCWQGLQKCQPHANQYPLATTVQLDGFGTAITGAEDSRWSNIDLSPAVQFTKYLKSLVDLTSNGEVFTKKLRFLKSDLINFNIHDAIRADRAEFIVRKMKIDFGDNIESAQFEMYMR